VVIGVSPIVLLVPPPVSSTSIVASIAFWPATNLPERNAVLLTSEPLSTYPVARGVTRDGTTFASTKTNTTFQTRRESPFAPITETAPVLFVLRSASLPLFFGVIVGAASVF